MSKRPLSKIDKPKDWGVPCDNCGYRWCFHDKACMARRMRTEKRKKKAQIMIATALPSVSEPLTQRAGIPNARTLES